MGISNARLASQLSLVFLSFHPQHMVPSAGTVPHSRKWENGNRDRIRRFFIIFHWSEWSHRTITKEDGRLDFLAFFKALEIEAGKREGQLYYSLCRYAGPLYLHGCPMVNCCIQASTCSIYITGARD